MKETPLIPRNGFTLVEVFIVVVILGILAATVLPQFTEAEVFAKQSALQQDLQVLRSQIELYRFQHEGRYPAHDSTDPDDFRDSMLLASQADGTTAAVGTPGYEFGPYFLGQLPPNPYTGGRGLRIVSDIDAAVPNETDQEPNGILIGWIYDPATGRIKGNNRGISMSGKPLDEF